MLKANGDLKSQVEGMQEALDLEKEKLKGTSRASVDHSTHDHSHHDQDHHNHDHDHSHSHSHADSDGHARGPHPSAASTPSSILSTPTRGPQRFPHRRAPSNLASVSENVDPSQDFYDPTSRSHPGAGALTSPPLVPVTASSAHDRSEGSRHVRRASLSLLKARMQDELNVEDLSVPRLAPGGALAGGAGSGRRTRSAVLQDNLVWCSCCQGDLWVV